jgi:hypothetical protein
MDLQSVKLKSIVPNANLYKPITLVKISLQKVNMLAWNLMNLNTDDFLYTSP